MTQKLDNAAASPSAIPVCSTTYEIIRKTTDEYEDCPGVKKGNKVTVVPTETKSFDSTRSSVRYKAKGWCEAESYIVCL